MTELDKPETEAALPAAEADQMTTMIGRMAMDPSVDLDRLDRLLAMKQTLDAENQRKAYAAAMAAAQASIIPVVKNKSNSHTRSSYADLGAIYAAAMPIITSHGLSISYDTPDGGPSGHQRVRAIIMHSGGHAQEIQDDFPLDAAGTGGKTNKTSIQAKGSTITYARRYLLCMAFNIPVGDDNDGNSRGQEPGRIDAEQFRDLRDLIEEAGADTKWLEGHYGVEDLSFLNVKQYADAGMRLRAKIKQAGQNE